MARARNLKPGYFKNDELAECGIEAHFLFSGLWVIADKEGRIKDRPKRIKSEVAPFYDFDVDECLEKLSRAGFILRYEVDGEGFIQIAKWVKHQSPHHKESESEIPAPPKNTSKKREISESKKNPKPDSGQTEASTSMERQAPEEGIREEEVKEEGIREEGEPRQDLDLVEVVDAFNAIPGIVHCRSLSEERRKKLKQRLKSKHWDWRAAFRRLPIPGEGWQPDFDWIIANDSNVLKLVEGKYDWRVNINKTKAQQKNENSDRVVADALERDRIAAVKSQARIGNGSK